MRHSQQGLKHALLKDSLLFKHPSLPTKKLAIFWGKLLKWKWGPSQEWWWCLDFQHQFHILPLCYSSKKLFHILSPRDDNFRPEVVQTCRITKEPCRFRLFIKEGQMLSKQRAYMLSRNNWYDSLCHHNIFILFL